MKKISLVFVIALAFGLIAPRFSHASVGNPGTGGDVSAEANNSGANYCSGGVPSGGPPASEVRDCSKNGDACAPINPPPTPWHNYCCYTNANNQGVLRDYRWQCCATSNIFGTTYAWKLAYQMRMSLGGC